MVSPSILIDVWVTREATCHHRDDCVRKNRIFAYILRYLKSRVSTRTLNLTDENLSKIWTHLKFVCKRIACLSNKKRAVKILVGEILITILEAQVKSVPFPFHTVSVEHLSM